MLLLLPCYPFQIRQCEQLGLLIFVSLFLIHLQDLCSCRSYYASYRADLPSLLHMWIVHHFLSRLLNVRIQVIDRWVRHWVRVRGGLTWLITVLPAQEWLCMVQSDSQYLPTWVCDLDLSPTWRVVMTPYLSLLRWLRQSANGLQQWTQLEVHCSESIVFLLVWDYLLCLRDLVVLLLRNPTNTLFQLDSNTLYVAIRMLPTVLVL